MLLREYNKSVVSQRELPVGPFKRRCRLPASLGRAASCFGAMVQRAVTATGAQRRRLGRQYFACDPVCRLASISLRHSWNRRARASCMHTGVLLVPVIYHGAPMAPCTVVHTLCISDNSSCLRIISMSVAYHRQHRGTTYCHLTEDEDCSCVEMHDCVCRPSQKASGSHRPSACLHTTAQGSSCPLNRLNMSC